MHAPYLTENRIDEFITSALAEDIGNGDHSTLGSVPESATNQAQLILKSEGMLAGVELAEKIFSHFDSNLQIEVLKQDGEFFEPGEVALYVKGSSR